MGKRETQRQQTRSLLRKQALSRFQKDGFQNTSVADIAADAGVTERTFYRHFASKEAVLFEDHESRFDWFRAALAVRPFGEPILDAVQVAVESFPDGREVVSQVAELRSRVLSEEAIEGHLRAAQGDFAAEIEHHLKVRLGDSDEDELHAAVMSRAIASALVAALDVWTRRAGGDPDELRKLTRQALDHLRRGI
jgi:AcrR family transcriptional regulator